MSMESPPWALSGGTATYPAEQTRRAMFAWAARTAANSPGIIAGGLLSPTDMQLSAAPSGLVINISVGECLIGGTEGGVQGGYYARNASTSSVTLVTANATNPRIDAVVGMVGDAGYTLPSGSTSGQVTLVGVTGTPTAGATLSNLNGAPATPASSLLLGYVLVPAAATNLSSGDILNVAVAAVPTYAVSNPTRTINTAYQPNTTRPTLVVATLAVGSASYMGAEIGATSSPSQIVGEASAQNDVPLTFIVPPGWYYKVFVASGTGSIGILTEFTL